jgi:hypothetical protein
MAVYSKGGKGHYLIPRILPIRRSGILDRLMGRILGIRSWHEARRQRKSRQDPSSETEERHV